jgi:ribosomal protein S18 acetylase RimI-like enzyme
MYEVRALEKGDFPVLMALEDEIFGAEGEAVLGPYYIRLCCEFFGDTCLVGLAGDRIVAYALCFVHDREAYCTTLAVHPQYQRSRLVYQLLRQLVIALERRVDSCWFTVKRSNHAALALHQGLGAHLEDVRSDFYGPGDERLVLRIDREGIARQSRRYRRLGVIEPCVREITDVAAC